VEPALDYQSLGRQAWVGLRYEGLVFMNAPGRCCCWVPWLALAGKRGDWPPWWSTTAAARSSCAGRAAARADAVAVADRDRLRAGRLRAAGRHRPLQQLAGAVVQALPKLGGLDDAQIERIVALKPDLVLAATSTRAVERLESLGLRVLALEPRSLADTASSGRARGAGAG
jgi:hypothetical protein